MKAEQHFQEIQPVRRWRWTSLLLIFTPWLVVQLGGLFSPGLLDDVDSVYTEVAREMLARHDYVTPMVDGIRFFDKPPLMYWMAAACMRIFGQHDWAARLPLALGVLALMLSVYALGIRFFAACSPEKFQDRGGLYAAWATGMCLGTYLYTRFYIPDILIALWMTLGIHLFLIALERVENGRSPAWASIGFFAVLALNVLTKGLIGLVFSVGVALLYLAWVRKLHLLRKLCTAAGLGTFLLIAVPWHVLAAVRNPPTQMPSGLGLPSRAGWTWFYLYNEHIARFLQKRIPHDYGQVPVPLFWLLLFVWLLPWTAFTLPAVVDAMAFLRLSTQRTGESSGERSRLTDAETASQRTMEAPRCLLLWAAVVLLFFTFSSRQEYYHLPALPALGLLAGGLLATADARFDNRGRGLVTSERAARQCLLASQWFLVPFGSCVFAVCVFYALTAPSLPPGTHLSDVLNSDPAFYNLSLGHIFDLTGRSMGLFRGPLLTVASGMLLLGPVSHLLRQGGRTFVANGILSAGAVLVLLGAHGGLVRFYPILGSKQLAIAIQQQRKSGDIVAIDGELTTGSTLLFYGRAPVYLIGGRINGPWFGSFWPDAPHLFLDEGQLLRLWRGPHRVFLLTYHPDQRLPALQKEAPVRRLQAAGGKTVLTNQ